MLEKTIQNLWDLSKKGLKAQYIQLLKQASVQTSLPSLTPKQLSLLIHSSSQCNVSEAKLWLDLSKAFKDKSPLMNAQDVTSCLWGFARQRSPVFNMDETLWPHLQRSLLDQLSKLNDHELVSVYHSTALLPSDLSKKDLPQITQLMEQKLIKVLKFIDFSSLSIIAFAANKRGDLASPLWTELETAFLKKAKSIKPRDVEVLTSLAFSFAKAGKGSNLFWTSIQKSFSLVSEFENIKPRALANICWVFAKNDLCREAAFWSQAIRHFHQNISKYNIVDFVHLTWALNKLNKVDEAVINTMVKYFNEFHFSDQKLKQQDVLNIGWIFHRNGVSQQRVWDTLTHNFEANLRSAEEHISRDFVFKSHLVFFQKDHKKRLWMEATERFYIKYMETLESTSENPKQFVENVIEIAFFARVNDLGSELFWSTARKGINFIYSQVAGTDDGLDGVAAVKVFLLGSEPKLKPHDVNNSRGKELVQACFLKAMGSPSNFVFFLHNLQHFKNFDQKYFDLLLTAAEKKDWLGSILQYLKSDSSDLARFLSHLPNKNLKAKSEIDAVTDRFISLSENEQLVALGALIEAYLGKHNLAVTAQESALASLFGDFPQTKSV